VGLVFSYGLVWLSQCRTGPDTGLQDEPGTSLGCAAVARTL
jgi:hypothetical protein